MNTAKNVQKFLKKKFKEFNLTNAKFSKNSGISPAATSRLINAIQINPDFYRILSIADYFNCSIDEVIGRKQNVYLSNTKKKFNKVYLAQVSVNIKAFIINKLKQQNLTAYSLARLCRLGENTISNFINNKNVKKILSTNTIISIANYFDCSIDEMIGRVIIG